VARASVNPASIKSFFMVWNSFFLRIESENSRSRLGDFPQERGNVERISEIRTSSSWTIENVYSLAGLQEFSAYEGVFGV
jgi:hypothetical protein